jgi:Ca2+/Na+ antiporter
MMHKTAILKKSQFNTGQPLFLFAMMAQLQLWDGIITQAFVMNGLATESNRIAAHLINEGNYLLFKFAGILACLGLLWIIGRRYPELTKLTASVVCIFYLAVIVWNFLVFFGS